MGLRLVVADTWTNRKEHTLFFVYYAGHGVMQGTRLCALCNGGQGGRMAKCSYPLDNVLQGLSNEKGAYVIAMYDCGMEA